MIPPPQGVLDAVMAPVTSVTRRVEFFESDGETPWGDPEQTSAALMDGTVSVDASRDERRSLDLTLDNSDNAFARDPNRGFWYDKVVKVYRGVQYTSFEEYSSLVLDHSPALYWRMGDPNVERDLSTHGAHGVRMGWPVVTRTLIDSPDSQGSVRFSEDNTYFFVDELSPSHPAVSANAWTMEAWVRPIGAGPAIGAQIFGRYDLEQNIVITPGLNFQAVVVDASAVTTTVTTSWAAVPGRIYHVAAVCDGAYLRLYVDGKLEGQQTFSGLPIQSTKGFAAGGDIGGARQLRGDVDECAYYTRVLSENELRQRYLSGTGRREITHSWDAQIGEFLIDQISEERFPKTSKITGRDYTKKCLQAQLPTAMTFDTDTPLEDLVRSMAANAGITKFILPKTGVTIGNTTDFDQGTERWSVIKKACEASAYEVFFTSDGYLTMRKQLDPVTSPVTLRFETGPRGNLVDWSKSSTDTEIRNRVICVSESNDEALPYYGEASNTNLASPTNITRLGERTFIYTSAFFTSDQQCRETAEAMLKVKALESFDVNFSSLVYPWTEAGEIVEFIDPTAPAYDPTRFLLSSFSVPLGLGTMEANAKRIVIVKEKDLSIQEDPVIPEEDFT